MQYFRTYKERAKFTLFTDHQALTHLLGMTQPRGRIARWGNHLQQFDFVICDRAGLFAIADSLPRLLVVNMFDYPQEINRVKIWEGTEEMKFIDGKYHVPGTMVPKILHLHHDTPRPGGHDGFWCTCNNLLKRFNMARHAG